MKTREQSNLDFFPKTAPFGHILKKTTHSLLVHGHSSWSVFGLHLAREGPKGLVK